MLAVQPQRFELPRDEISMDSAPSMELHGSESSLGMNKQQEKKSIFSPYKILLGLAVFFMLVMVSFKVYDEFIAKPISSEINSVHGKIIQNADSSSKDKSSTTGSSSSKSAKNNDKPNTFSQPASKTPTSNNKNLGSSSSEQGGDEQEEDKKDGDKNKKFLDKSKTSDTKSSKNGVSTDQDSDSVESQDDDAINTNGIMWPVNKQDGPAPLIGSTRN